MELVLAVFAWESRQALVRGVQHAVADEAVFDALDFLVDVALPEQNCRDDISVPDLQQVFDGQNPLVLLSFGQLELLADFNTHRPERIVVWNLDFETHRNFSLGVLSHDLFS